MSSRAQEDISLKFPSIVVIQHPILMTVQPPLHSHFQSAIMWTVEVQFRGEGHKNPARFSGYVMCGPRRLPGGKSCIPSPKWQLSNFRALYDNFKLQVAGSSCFSLTNMHRPHQAPLHFKWRGKNNMHRKSRVKGRNILPQNASSIK